MALLRSPGGVWIAAVCAVTIWGGCLGDRCGDNQRYERGRCVVESDGGVEQGVADGSASAETGPDGAGLGELCIATEECGSPANLCLILPGQSRGYCSFEGCTPDVSGGAGDCPEPQRFTCQDISSLSPGQAPLCLLTCDLEQDDDQCPAGHICSDLSLVLGGLPPLCFPGAR